jgi:hypothetical protein
MAAAAASVVRGPQSMTMLEVADASQIALPAQ